MRSTSAAAAPMDEEGSSSPHRYYSTLRRKKNKGRIKQSQLCVDNNDHDDEQEHYQQQLQEQDTEDEGSGGGLLRAINDNERLSHHGGCYRQDEYDCCAASESTAINNTTTTTTTTTKTIVLILLVVFVITGMVIQLYYDERSVIENNNSNNNNFHHRRDSSPSTSSASSNGNTAATASMASSSTTTTTSTLLTRTSQLSSLLANLDASDVIECYIVTRMANLANVASSSSSSSSMNSSSNGGNGGNKKYRRNVQGSDPDDDDIDTTGSTTTTTSSSSSSSIPTGPILIRKAALAFRYRPKVAHVTPSSSGNTAAAAEATTTTTTNPEKYFELTLEYGPQRAGASKTSESMPMVHIDMEIMSNYYDGGDDGNSINNSNSNNNNNNIGKYVSWDNQGSIYYSTHISNEWSGAYYMSSITGVVLEKILEKVIEYPNKRPRYQPFEVVSLPSNNIILKSSGSDDFVWDMFRDMADLYVDIDPILVPPRGKVQFYVADPEEEEIEEEDNLGGGEKTMKKQKRHLPNPNVKRVKGVIESSKAAAFYEHFFSCASAKKTGDYSMYLPPASLAPSPVPPMINDDIGDSIVPTTNTTAAASNGSDTDNVDDRGSRRRLDEEVKVPSNFTNVDLLVDENKDVLKGVENSSKSSPNKSEDVVKTAEVVSGDDVDATKIAEGEEKISMSPQLDHDDDDDYVKEIEITDPDAVEITDPDEDHDASEDDGDDAAKVAEKAAIEAAEKAEAAAAVAATNSSSPEDSAKAASEAAIAAKKAADATVAARAKSSAEGLLSGDGTLMTSILSSCFSDPKYGIRKMHANDGASDLTGSEQSTQIPSTYAYVYLDGDVFIRLNLTAPYWGTSSVLQTVPPPHAKVDGRGDVVDWAIFLLLMVATVFGFVVIVHQLGVVIDKRLQFRHVFHPLADDDSVEMERLEKGGGLPHSIGIDAIPVSLGGKLSHYDGDKGHGPPTSYKDRISDSSIGDERNGLLDIELATREKTTTMNSPKLASPNASELPTSLRLKEEAPDLVERPSLKSMSKVALPHTSPRNDQERVPRRRSLEIDTDMPRLPSIS